MTRSILTAALSLLFCLPAMAQDLPPVVPPIPQPQPTVPVIIVPQPTSPSPVNPQPPTPVVVVPPLPVTPTTTIDWVKIIAEIGSQLAILLGLVFTYLKAHAALQQGIKNEQQGVKNDANVTAGRIEARQDVAVQTHELKVETAAQTKDLILAQVSDPKPVLDKLNAITARTDPTVPPAQPAGAPSIFVKR